MAPDTKRGSDILIGERILSFCLSSRPEGKHFYLYSNGRHSLEDEASFELMMKIAKREEEEEDMHLHNFHKGAAAVA